MSGHLLSRGIQVQQHRIRESVDPEGTLARRLHVTHCRCYSVPAPRSLFHMDGDHKLIRYIVVCCIGGSKAPPIPYIWFT